MERQVRPGSKIPNRNIRESYRRRLLPPRGRPRRPDGRVGLRIGLLAVLGRGRPLPRARRGDGPLQGLLGRPDADRVGQPGGAGRGGRLRLAAVARLGPGRRPLLIHVRLRAGAGRPGAADLGGQHGMALRAQRGARPGMAARGPRDPPHGRRQLLPPRGRPRRPDGRVGLRIGLLAVLGRGRPLPRARRGDGPLQGLLGRPDADRVGQPGGAGRGGRLRLAAVARLGPGRRPLLIHVRLRAGAGRPGAADLGGQHGMALRAQRGGPPRRGSLPSLQDLSNTF